MNAWKIRLENALSWNFFQVFLETVFSGLVQVKNPEVQVYFLRTSKNILRDMFYNAPYDLFIEKVSKNLSFLRCKFFPPNYGHFYVRWKFVQIPRYALQWSEWFKKLLTGCMHVYRVPSKLLLRRPVIYLVPRETFATRISCLYTNTRLNSTIFISADTSGRCERSFIAQLDIFIAKLHPFSSLDTRRSAFSAR